MEDKSMKNKIILLSLALLCSMTGFAAYGMEMPGQENLLDNINNEDKMMKWFAEDHPPMRHKDIKEAARYGDIAAVREFLERGDIADTTLGEALIEATEDGNFEIARLLLEKGANKYIENSNKQTAMSIALSYGHYDIAQLLVYHGFDVNYENNSGVILANPDLDDDDATVWLMHHGADINRKDSKGLTPLYRKIVNAAGEMCKEDIRLFHSLGADMNAVNGEGCNLLFHPIIGKEVRCVKWLIKYGLDTSRKNAGMTPLEQAMMYKSEAEHDCCVKSNALLAEAFAIKDYSTKLEAIKNIPSKVQKHFGEHPRIKIIELLTPEGLARIKSEKEIKDYNAFKRLGQSIVAGGNAQKKVAEQIVNSARSIDIAPIASARAPGLIEFCKHIKQPEKEQPYTKKAKK